MKMTVEIEMDNAAFEDDAGELSQILQKIAEHVNNGVGRGNGWRLYDIAGNSVGFVKIV